MWNLKGYYSIKYLVIFLMFLLIRVSNKGMAHRLNYLPYFLIGYTPFYYNIIMKTM
jgi:hypothetical protein